MTETNPNDALERLAELQRRAALQATTEIERELSRQRFLARIDGALEASRPRVHLLRWGVPAAAAALCIAAALLLFWRPPVLTFHVQGAELSGKYVSAPLERSAELRFSDESTLIATAGSRLRVEDTSPLGARILLERGSTSVKVVHKTSTAWTFAAGPFEVHVTGTRFDLAWDPSRETCDLLLHEGSVEVRGPTGSGPVVVRGGQRFRGDAQQRTMQVVELEANAALPPATAAKPDNSVAPAAPAVAEPPEPTPAVTASSKAARPEARAPSWSERIAQGNFKEIVSEAEGRGIPSCLSGCSATDLRALSDAARYTGNSALAQRSLSSLRQRFPGAQGTEAAFLLGRLEEQRGAMATALAWYDSYLREAPSGSFAAEALAGKLRAVKATQGKQAAEPLAREYLRRFPKGVHVRTAREILGE
jgi:ferric-dicitrate binding protein FerR (iron transport regulator)